MARGMLPVDTSFLRPHPPSKFHARACALHPPLVGNHVRARCPRAFGARQIEHFNTLAHTSHR
jgi:hypothetical protein